MRKFLLAVAENTTPLSKKLLFSCFLAGYLLAMIFYGLCGPQIHHILNNLIDRL
jgi:hypothetical protein